jgi:hypothetical protein
MRGLFASGWWHTSRRREVTAIGVVVGASLALLVLSMVSGGSGSAGLPAEKQAALDRIAQDQAVGRANPAPKRPGEGPLLSTDLQGSADRFPGVKTSLAGNGMIVETEDGPPGARDSLWLNLWQETSATRSVAVYAGGVADDPDQGLVVWVTTGPPPAFANATEHDLPTPIRAGAVRVVSAVGELLTLQAADGTQLVFDASNGTFR